MWVILLHDSVAIFIIIKVGLEKCKKFIPRNVMTYHFKSEGQNVMKNWKIPITDRTENVLA